MLNFTRGSRGMRQSWRDMVGNTISYLPLVF